MPRGRPKGLPKTGGRKPGSQNKVTVMGREFALGILNSEEYREWVEESVRTKALPPQIEVLLWHYAVGKPKESVELTGANGGPLETLSRIERVIVDGRQSQD